MAWYPTNGVRFKSPSLLHLKQVKQQNLRSNWPGNNSKLLLLAANPVSSWVGNLNFEVCYGVGVCFEKELLINQFSNKADVKCAYFSSVTFFFVSVKAYSQHSYLSRGRTLREVKIQVSQPPIDLKHRFILGSIQICSKLILLYQSEMQTLQPECDWHALAKIK